MSHIAGHRALTVLALLSVTLAGCSTYPTRIVDTEQVILDRTQTEIPDSELLDVRIEIFNPGTLPEGENDRLGLSETIRKAEAAYMPVKLRDTLQQTGYWGAVRVVPAGTAGAEVRVAGRIINSDGELLEVEISAADASGAQWFKKTYQSVVDVSAYEQSNRQRLEVFQKLYDRISNDLARYRGKMTRAQVQAIRRISELRFAAEFAPSVFAGYLQKSAIGTGQPADPATSSNPSTTAPANPGDTRYRIARLPAEDDPMLLRIRRIRARDYLLVDTLDNQYDGMYREMQEDYTNWRKARLSEVNAIRKVDEEKNNRTAANIGLLVGAVLLGAAIQSNSSNPYSNSASTALVATAAAIAVQNLLIEASNEREESAINLEGIVEDGQSFSAAIRPLVVEVEGQTLELTGTAEVKYRQWKDILRRLSEQELGAFPARPAPVAGSAI